MVRTQIYLTEEEHEGLVRLAHNTGRKQSELIREAVDAILAKSNAKDRLACLRQAKGIWKDRKDLTDLKELRREFNRV